MLEKNSFIVSCQALENDELYGEGIMTKMAHAAINGGANAIRTSQIHNVESILKETNVPVIGLIKRKYSNSNVYITPTSKEIQALIDTGVHIIAIDATLRKRPKEKLEELVKYFNKNKKYHQILMADCSNEEDILNADKLNFDIIGTTLRGYTEETIGKNNVENNYEFLKKARSLTKKYLIAEGGIDTPEYASKAIEIVDGVVVGSAITRPKFITEQFFKQIRRKNG